MARLPGFLVWSLSCCLGNTAASQPSFPHTQAHAHNDYEHARPLMDALHYGFISVEADVHLYQGKLRIGHHSVSKDSPELEDAYISPLDSILKHNQGKVYDGYDGPFYLMIDIKTEAGATYRAIVEVLEKYPDLLCIQDDCPVKIFLSGNRPMKIIMEEGYRGIGLDGRPGDMGKNYPMEMMPVVSDNFNTWSSWNGKGSPDDMQRIVDLAERAHREGKLLRLWAIPDNGASWRALSNAGVDLINSDKLKELHQFFVSGEDKE